MNTLFSVEIWSWEFTTVIAANQCFEMAFAGGNFISLVTSCFVLKEGPQTAHLTSFIWASHIACSRDIILLPNHNPVSRWSIGLLFFWLWLRWLWVWALENILAKDIFLTKDGCGKVRHMVLKQLEDGVVDLLDILFPRWCWCFELHPCKFIYDSIYSTCLRTW